MTLKSSYINHLNKINFIKVIFYMDKKEEFKVFLKNNPDLINYIKENNGSIQKLYEVYDVYGDNKEVWDKYKKESRSIDLNNLKDIVKNIDAAFVEIKKAFKSPSQTFIEQWGTKEANYKEDLSIGEDDIRFLQDVNTSQKNLGYAPNEVGKISRNKGILSTLNTLFLE